MPSTDDNPGKIAVINSPIWVINCSVLYFTCTFFGWNRTSSHFIRQMPQVFTKILLKWLRVCKLKEVKTINEVPIIFLKWKGECKSSHWL